MTLVEKQQQFSSLVADLIVALESKGFLITLGEAWRSPETCALYEAEGKGIKNSNHMRRLGIDLNLWWNGKLCESIEDYKMAGEIWKAFSCAQYQCAWGGDFVRTDAYHFSIVHDGVS